MGTLSSLKIAVLATSIVLAMASTSAMAATPTATQLPGAGAVIGTSGTAAQGTVAAGVQTMTVTGNAVINWGATSGVSLNADQPGGFNVGSAAKLTFDGTVAANAASGTKPGSVLNVDVSGNASQIFGKLDMKGGGNLFVANTNGVIVGATAVISNSGSGDVGLIANARGTVAFDGSATKTSIEYQGSGGDVTVAKGADISGANVLVSGGGVVNVDLSAFTSGVLKLNAGVKNSSSTLVNDNTAAVLTAAGDLSGATLAGFASAGSASTAGMLTLSGGITRVDGTLTNTGTLTLGDSIKGGLVNSSKLALDSNTVSVGSLVNNGALDGADGELGSYGLTTSKGGITNNGQMTNLGALTSNGAFTNAGQIAVQNVQVKGGDLVNNGSLSTVDNGISVVNGSISNTGQINARYLETASDSSITGFTKGAAYSITNSGIVTNTNANGDLQLGANTASWASRVGNGNDSIGSVINTGTLQVGTGGGLYLAAYSDVSLGGSVKAGTAGAYKVLSATNALDILSVEASDYTDTFGNTAGAGAISTDIVTSHGAFISGNQVKLLANLSSVDATGAPAGDINIVAGPKSASDYAVRVATGKTVTASEIDVNGDTTGDAPNVIVQGTLAANAIYFGSHSPGPGFPVSSSPVSDVFTGPTGSLSLLSSAPTLVFDFTGSLKTVAYNNDTSNFRFNGLQVDSAGPLTLTLNPVAYTTNGTSNGLSAVNILVNSDVTLLAPDNTSVVSGDSAVTGVTNIPNTHLVIQSSGSINVGTQRSNEPPDRYLSRIDVSRNDVFYWPGYVYLGNVSADSKGNALPGTLGLGSITTNGDFNNVLPGDIAGASGIHFITQFPLTLGGEVVTNANALVSFGTDLLNQAYASGTLKGNFFGGVKGSGTVVNYDKLDSSLFVTQAPVATR